MNLVTCRIHLQLLPASYPSRIASESASRRSYFSLITPSEAPASVATRFSTRRLSPELGKFDASDICGGPRHSSNMVNEVANSITHSSGPLHSNTINQKTRSKVFQMRSYEFGMRQRKRSVSYLQDDKRNNMQSASSIVTVRNLKIQ